MSTEMNRFLVVTVDRTVGLKVFYYSKVNTWVNPHQQNENRNKWVNQDYSAIPCSLPRIRNRGL